MWESMKMSRTLTSPVTENPLFARNLLTITQNPTACLPLRGCTATPKLHGMKCPQPQDLRMWPYWELGLYTGNQVNVGSLVYVLTQHPWYLYKKRTVTYQGPWSGGFSSQKDWSGLPFPPPGDLPNPGGWTQVSCIEGRFFTSWATREAPNPILLVSLWKEAIWARDTEGGCCEDPGRKRPPPSWGGRPQRKPPPPPEPRDASLWKPQTAPLCLSSPAQTDTRPQARSGWRSKVTLSRDLRGHLARVKFVSGKTATTAGQQGCSGNELSAKPGFRTVRVLTEAGREVALVCHPRRTWGGSRLQKGRHRPHIGKACQACPGPEWWRKETAGVLGPCPQTGVLAKGKHHMKLQPPARLTINQHGDPPHTVSSSL